MQSSTPKHKRPAGMNEDAPKVTLREQLVVLRHTPKAMRLVWSTSPRLAVVLGVNSVVFGALPAAIAWVGKRIVDGVLKASETSAEDDLTSALFFVGLELLLVLGIGAARQIQNTGTALLRARLAQKVNEMVLEKSLTLSLSAFEDSDTYDLITKVRREASQRPLSVVLRVFDMVSETVTLVTYGVLLWALSPLAALILVVAALPTFVAQTRFSQAAFRLFSWRAPEKRMQNYLESLIAREDHVKEVKLFDLGALFLGRYRAIFEKVYAEDRALQLKRGFWVFVLELLSTFAFYGAYVWVAVLAVQKTITLGEMTMYLMVFREGQSSLSSLLSSVGGMFEDNLYLSNLYELLALPSQDENEGIEEGTTPGDGIRFEDVAFSYPGAERAALSGVNLHLTPGKKLALVGENGAGKTTLIKLLTRLYEPTEGRILLDGVDLKDWRPDALRERIGVIFQDFVRYQLLAGENIGVGDREHLEDRERWEKAAEMGMADEVIEGLVDGYETQLGRWFSNGQELSLGQWQKVALSRAFMRERADILVLDEPTASMDAEAEATIFERFGELTEARMAILISHRFSTVRMADEVVVLDDGRIIEQGTHDELMEQNGRYAHLFELQAEGYR